MYIWPFLFCFVVGNLDEAKTRQTFQTYVPFRTFSDRFGPFRTVSDHFQIVFGPFRTVNDASIPDFKIAIGQGGGPAVADRRSDPSGPTAVPRPAPALAN